MRSSSRYDTVPSALRATGAGGFGNEIGGRLIDDGNTGSVGRSGNVAEQPLNISMSHARAVAERTDAPCECRELCRLVIPVLLRACAVGDRLRVEFDFESSGIGLRLLNGELRAIRSIVRGRDAQLLDADDRAQSENDRTERRDDPAE